VSRSPLPLARAYSACEAIARAHDAPVPVAWRLLPAAMRPHVAAVYAYARIAAGLADEGAAPAAERLARLDAWRRRLHAAVAVERSAAPPHAHEDLIVLALAHSIRSLDLPITLCDDLVSAFGQDTMTTRYDSWAALFAYCRLSAHPFGRLVLRIGGDRDEALDRSSDALCTALQLTSLWRDLGAAWIVGRLYVPRDVSAVCRAREMDLNGPRLTEAWTAALRQCVDRTRAAFESARALGDGIRGPLRHERRFTWLRGLRMLERVEGAGAALPSHRPSIRPADVPVLLWRTARWPRGA
jgi:squalene synthase HpnC